MQIELGIIEVDIGQDDTDEGFSLVQTILEGFDILRGGIATTVGRLVVGAFCRGQLG